MYLHNLQGIGPGLLMVPVGLYKTILFAPGSSPVPALCPENSVRGKVNRPDIKWSPLWVGNYHLPLLKI